VTRGGPPRAVTMNVALFQPEIPPNTGNVIRLCANTGARLHLIEPLGFTLDDRRLRRAGLDYHEWTRVTLHRSLDACLGELRPAHVYALTTRGSRCYTDVSYTPGDLLLFGPETRGLPEEALDQVPSGQWLRIPMLDTSRSLNLSNAVAVVVYEAWRQAAFSGASRA
jgi:tRNA (cytidine/uridine-2'-O-)-methyltransferase